MPKIEPTIPAKKVPKNSVMSRIALSAFRVGFGSTVGIGGPNVVVVVMFSIYFFLNKIEINVKDNFDFLEI